MKRKHIEEKRKLVFDLKNADEDVITETKRATAYEARAELQSKLEEGSHSDGKERTYDQIVQDHALHKANQEKIAAIREANKAKIEALKAKAGTFRQQKAAIDAKQLTESKTEAER